VRVRVRVRVRVHVCVQAHAACNPKFKSSVPVTQKYFYIFTVSCIKQVLSLICKADGGEGVKHWGKPLRACMALLRKSNRTGLWS